MLKQEKVGLDLENTKATLFLSSETRKNPILLKPAKVVSGGPVRAKFQLLSQNTGCKTSLAEKAYITLWYSASRGFSLGSAYYLPVQTWLQSQETALQERLPLLPPPLDTKQKGLSQAQPWYHHLLYLG